MYKSVAVLTGGAGHVGSITATLLAKRGVDLVIMDKNESAASVLTHKLNKKFGIKAEALALDLLDETSFFKARDHIKQSFGKLDYLINIAAFYDDVPGFGADFEDESYDAWLKVLKVNLMAPFFLSQTLAPMIKQSKNAAIVNVSSMYGVVGPDHSLYEGTSMTNPCSYSVSKAGLNQLTKWLGMVLAPEVRVNTVSPGGIERGQPLEFIEKYKKRTPLNRMCTDEEVANAIVYLLSPESSYINAHNLVIDGGWTVW